MPILIAMMGISFAKFYGNIINPLVFTADRKLFPISLMLREVLISGKGHGGQEVAVSTIGLLLIPVLIGVLSIWISIVVADKTE